MHIPEGYKLVPVELLERVVCLDNSFRRHRQAQHDLVTFLAAPVPPKVEAQPAAYQFQDRDGKWRGFVDERHYHSTVADGSWPIRALCTHSDAGACGEIALLEQERDASLAREAASREELYQAKEARDAEMLNGVRLQQRLTDAEKLFDAAVTALNEIAKVSRIGEKPFEIATLAIGEMSALKPAEGDYLKSCEVTHRALSMENQRITPARFNCLACGDMHEGSGNLPCPKMTVYSGIKP